MENCFLGVRPTLKRLQTARAGAAAAEAVLGDGRRHPGADAADEAHVRRLLHLVPSACHRPLCR